MQIRTALYLALLTGIFLAVGYVMGGNDGMVSAFILAIIMNIGTYWFSDGVVLFMYGAKPITREENPTLHATIVDIARAMGIPTPRIFRSTLPTPNAFATGRNPHHAAVVVTTSLEQLLTPDELKGVLAHELAHVANRDILLSSIAATIAGALSILLRIAIWGGDDRDRRVGGVAMLFLLIVAPIIALLLQLAVSRSREFHADDTGARTLRSGHGLASALAKIDAAARAHPLRGTPTHQATAHLFIVNPFAGSFLMRIFSTHPPVAERIRRLTQHSSVITRS